MKQKIKPFLWFDNQAEEAANFYTSIFKDSRIITTTRPPDGPQGPVTVVSFEIEGQIFLALNGGPMFKFNPSISFVVSCKDQDEVDYYWSKLLEGGEEQQCAWLTDKYGVSWQIVPEILPELLGDPDPARSGRAMRAMLKMKKIDIQALKNAVENG